MAKQFQVSKNESFIVLSKELVNQFWDQEYVPLKKQNGSYTNTLLLKKLYYIIISHRKDAYGSSSSSKAKLNELEEIAWYSHVLYKKRLVESANRLDELLRTLKDKGLLTNHCDVRVVLQFFSHLIDADVCTKEESLSFLLPWKVPSVQNFKLGLSSGPLNYNDAQSHYVTPRWYYTHFPSRLFENQMQNSMKGNYSFTHKLSHCQEEPGSNLQYNFFKIEDGNSDNILGALVGPKNTTSITPDTELCIPGLPNIPDDYSFVPFFLSQYVDGRKMTSKSTKTQISTSLPTRDMLDEGYASSQGSYEDKNSNNCNDIWEMVLESSLLPDHYTWESEGKSLRIRQKPFISEAGNETMDKYWMIKSHHLSHFTCLFPNYPIPNVTLKSFCSDIIHLLMGVPSSCFIWNKALKNFEVSKVIYCQGISPESIHLQIDEFLRCGNQIKHLEEIVNQIEQHSENEHGFVYKAFVLSIKSFLVVYRKKVFLHMDEDKILMLKYKLENLISKVRFLYNICFSTVAKAGIPFKGLSIIGALKNEFFLTHEKSNSFLLLSLLSASCKPFFRFLEKWIYEGELYDPAFEFIVYQNKEALNSRDRSYWLKGHYFNHASLKEIPEVLKNVLIQTFHCGKSLNFLQTFAPQSFLLQNKCIPFPRITLCMTINEVENTREKCFNYLKQMEKSNNCITLKKHDDLQARKLHQLQSSYKESLNRVPSQLQSAYLHKDYAVKIEQKKKALQVIKLDIEQARMYKALEERKIQVENLETQNQYDKILWEKDEEDSIRKDKLKNFHHHYMSYLEERENFSRRLEGFSVETVHANFEHEERSPQASLYSCIDSMSQTSLASEDMETPITEAIPNVIEDYVHEVNKNDNLPYSVTERFNEANNNPLIKNLDVVESEMFEETPYDHSLESIFAKLGTVKLCLMSNCVGCSKLLKNNQFALHSNMYSNKEKITRDACEHIKWEKKFNSVKSLHYKVDNQGTPHLPIDSINGNLNDIVLEQNYSDIKSSSISSSGNENIYNAKDLCSFTETTGYFPNIKHIRNTEDLKSSNFAHMRKSKSDTFDSDRNKRKGLQSSLSDLSEGGTPIIVDNMGGEVLKHRGRNIHGHVSDSVIQNILWRNTPNWDLKDDQPSARFIDKDLLLSRMMEPSNKLLHYSTVKFCLSEQDPMEDIGKLLLKDVSDHRVQQTCEAKGTFFLPPSMLIATSSCLMQALYIHVSTQTRLVNETVLSYILIHEQLIDHLSAIKSFLLLDDISFARPLASGLYNKFPLTNCPQMLCNPVNLNGLLHEAVAASQFAKSPFADNLSFVIANMSSSINIMSNPLNHIHLHYHVKWPCCVILDDFVFNTYGKIWKFLIKLHYIIWTLDDIFQQIVSIDRDPFYKKKKSSVQFRKISIYRFEIHQLVKNLFDYIVHQGIQCGWIKFQSNLRKNVATLDDLYAAHCDLLNDILGKCFLTSQASIVHDILQGIFDKVISFRSILLSHSWKLNAAIKQLEHPQFSSLQKIYQEIKQLSLFLNKLLLKILHCTYSDHLQHLVDQLSFNINNQRTALSF